MEHPTNPYILSKMAGKGSKSSEKKLGEWTAFPIPLPPATPKSPLILPQGPPSYSTLWCFYLQPTLSTSIGRWIVPNPTLHTSTYALGSPLKSSALQSLPSCGPLPPWVNAPLAVNMNPSHQFSFLNSVILVSPPATTWDLSFSILPLSPKKLGVSTCPLFFYKLKYTYFYSNTIIQS